MNPNRSRSGAGSSPARVVAPTRVNGAISSGIAVAPGPLPDHHVDPEVLHGQVEHLLGGPGQPVDLVDEHHVPLAQRGQDGGQVTGALDGRPAGDPQRRAQLRGDDHRERGLAQPGRPGQQHVVGGPAAAQRALQHQGQLLADPGLADDLRQPLGPQRTLDDPLVRVGQRRHEPVPLCPGQPVPLRGRERLLFQGGQARCLALGVLGGGVRGLAAPARPGTRPGHVRLSLRSAARSATDTSTSPAGPPARSAATAAMACSASRAGQPRLTRPART